MPPAAKASTLSPRSSNATVSQAGAQSPVTNPQGDPAGFGTHGELDEYAEQAQPREPTPLPAAKRRRSDAAPSVLGGPVPRQQWQKGVCRARGSSESRVLLSTGSIQRVSARRVRAPAPASAESASCTSDSGSYVSSAGSGSDSASSGSGGSVGSDAEEGRSSCHSGRLGPYVSRKGVGLLSVPGHLSGSRDGLVQSVGGPGGRQTGQAGAGGAGGSGQPQPWPAHPALQAWRESARECHFYAYAPPNR